MTKEILNTINIIERFDNHLSKSRWSKIENKNITEYYCDVDPDFRIIELPLDMIKEDKVSEADRFFRQVGDSCPIHRSEIAFLYNNIPVKYTDMVIWWIDNGRAPVPLPKTRYKNDSIAVAPEDMVVSHWELSKSSKEYKVVDMIASCNGQDLQEILTHHTRIKLI